MATKPPNDDFFLAALEALTELGPRIKAIEDAQRTQQAEVQKTIENLGNTLRKLDLEVHGGSGNTDPMKRKVSDNEKGIEFNRATMRELREEMRRLEQQIGIAEGVTATLEAVKSIAEALRVHSAFDERVKALEEQNQREAIAQVARDADDRVRRAEEAAAAAPGKLKLGMAEKVIVGFLGAVGLAVVGGGVAVVWFLVKLYAVAQGAPTP